MRIVLAASLLAVSAPALARDTLPLDLGPKELIEYLKSGGEDARKQACKRLGARKSPAAIPALGEAAVHDASAKVRVECVQALQSIGPNAESARFLREAALNDPDRKVRTEAIDSLQDVEPKTGGDVAAQVLAQDDELAVRKQACRSIERRRWSDANDAVVKVVSDSSEKPELRRACLQALVAIGTDEDYSLVHQMMLEETDEELRREASAQIEHNPKPASLESLCQALKDANERIASNAAKGLKRLGLKEGAKCLRDIAPDVKSDRLAGEMEKIANELER